MARTLSSTAIASQNAQETGEVWLVLLTIAHADLTSTIRVVNNNEDIVSRGLTFQAFPFEIILPNEDPDQPPKAYLRIDNADRTVITAVRGIASAPSVTIEVVLASAPNTVEISLEGFTLRNVSFSATEIEGELLFESIFGEPLSASMTPSRFPGMF